MGALCRKGSCALASPFSHLYRCRGVIYRNPENDDRAERIGNACPCCACEMISVGRHGSPGRVRASEILHSILIGPADLSGDAIAITLVTHAERKGMSVLPGAASDAEFETIIERRVKGDPKRWFSGVASLHSADVRSLPADADTELRSVGDRLYCVFDSDMVGLPYHADIIATMPRRHHKKKPKDAWRAERGRISALMLNQLSTPAQFRAGSLANVAPTSPPRRGPS
jgi:hypothetical protein